jgi:hypothetical protein
MDREQAAEVKKQLLNATRALDRANEAISKAGMAEGKLFEEILRDAYLMVYFKLLPAIYREHPELEPPPERPRIDSKLRWEDVSLPPGITEAEIDAMIFSLLKPQQQKMAKIVGNAGMRFMDESKQVSFEIIAARIIALEEAGRIEGFGDLRMWRFSEIRLP